MNTLFDLLQNRAKFISEIGGSVDLKKKIVHLLVISVIGFAAYGFIMGLSNSFLQSLSSMVKLPLLYLVTTLICFPTFFIFYSLFGSKTSVSQTLAYLLTAICVMSLILLAFAPVTLFFLLTSNDYPFFKLLNVLFFSVSGIVGVSFFRKMIVSIDNAEAAATRKKFLFFWMILFAFVGTQLGWTLRPFFGAPSMPFELVRKLGGNFYRDVFASIAALFDFVD